MLSGNNPLNVKDINELSARYKTGEITADQVESLLKNPIEYQRLITCFDDLTSAAENLPEFKNTLIAPILFKKEQVDTHTNDEYDRLITDNYQLAFIAHFFPDHKDDLIRPILEDSEKYKHYISGFDDLDELLKAYPEHKHALIAPMLKDQLTYNKIITNNIELACIAEHADKDQKNQLLICLMNQPEKFKKMFTYYKYEVMPLTERFPDFKDILLTETAEEALKNYHARNKKILPVINDLSELPDVAEKSPNEKDTNEKISIGEAEPTKLTLEPTTSATTTAPNTLVITKKVVTMYELILQAVERAINQYKESFKSNNSSRGPAGSLFYLNHGKNGLAYADKLKSDLKKCADSHSYLDVCNIINRFLRASHFNNHSLGSFLLDELLNIENSPWEEKDVHDAFPAYQRKNTAEKIKLDL